MSREVVFFYYNDLSDLQLANTRLLVDSTDASSAGWSFKGPPDLRIPEFFLEATRPKGDAEGDPIYFSGKDSRL